MRSRRDAELLAVVEFGYDWRVGRVPCLFVPALAVALVVAPSREADACGGVFCDAAPQSMPVDQSGENILFVVQPDHVEVHIQIQYVGDPAKFAWVIPLTAVPELSVGSDLLFQNLLAGTVPSYGFSTTRDDCRRRSPLLGRDDATAAGGGEPESSNGSGGPQVILQQSVGAFDIAVLQGGTIDEVIAWLDANDYQQDDDAAPILAQYLEEGALFGAIKLTASASSDLDQIHPIVLRYAGTEPCVPLRLTRIAAVEDMDVRVFFLGQSRVAPTNYRHVLVNPLKIDWLSFGANYKDVITAAVDVEHADGRAFVTEFAGPTQLVPRVGIFEPGWNADVFRTLPMVQIVDELVAQGFVSCLSPGNGCIANHPLIEPLLVEALNVDLETFADCPECFADSWDGNAFADLLAERIIEPGRHANALLDTWPYVTRMYTTISPHEMLTDPIFHANADLPEVPNARLGTNRIRCSGDTVFTLPDGREVFIPEGQGWPDFQTEMPWVEEVDEVPDRGAPMVLVQNTETIDRLLDDYNAEHGWPIRGCPACQIGDRDGDRLTPMLIAIAAIAIRRRRRRVTYCSNT